jgi:lipopolysaccharide transport system ATP-binding protein
MLNVPFLSGEHGQCVNVKFIWKSHVSGGEYFLNIGCHTYVDGAQQFLDVRRSVAKINFEPTPESIGFVNLELDFELLD